MRRRADAARAQLLGQARRHARALPRARLAERRLPAGRPPGPAGCLHEIAAAADVDPDEIPTAVDGCGVAHVRAPARADGARCSRGSSSSTAATAWRRAMRAHPELIRGPRGGRHAADAELAGWTAKGGAEGLLCAAGPGRLGVALKVEDGACARSARRSPRCSRRLGFEIAELGVVPAREHARRARRRDRRRTRRRTG